jgi:regulator of protease activity HflC (stomatin/prohibitin superfamily)
MFEFQFVDPLDSLGRKTIFWLALVIVPITLFLGLLVVKLFFIFSVRPGFVGMILRAGKIQRNDLDPGWYFVIPILQSGERVYIGLQRIPLEEEARTKDQAIVTVRGTGQYRVLREKAAVAEFEVQDPDDVIKDRLLSALRSAIGKRSAAECFENKEEISADIIGEVREGLATLGFEIVQVPIIEVAPHKDVVKAINDVQAAQRATDVERARAEAIQVRTAAEARAQAHAAEIRGEGQAKALAAQAAGYLDMIRAVTGDASAMVDVRTASTLIMFFESMGMKRSFAQSGKASAVVLPDDQAIISEIAQLVPALVSHEAIDNQQADFEERLDHLSQAEMEELLRERLSEPLKEVGSEYLDAIKTGASEAAKSALDRMPHRLRWLAQKIAERL